MGAAIAGRHWGHVTKRTLLGIAGTVWMIAGVNVARLGIIDYEIVGLTPLLALGTVLVFLGFGTMFFRISVKHARRIEAMSPGLHPWWHFFDAKGYVIMAIMMGGGIGLRALGVFPLVFIAFFYTGLGTALMLAGVFFWYQFFRYPQG